MKYKSRTTIQEAEQYDVSQKCISDGAQEQWRSTVNSIFHETLTCNLGPNALSRALSRSRIDLHYFAIRIQIMLINPERQSFVIFIDEVMLQLSDGTTGHDHVLVHPNVLGPSHAGPPQSQEPSRIITAKTYPASPEIDPSFD